MGMTAKDRHVYTRQEWQAVRDKAGGKSGMVKGVDIGPLLDAYHKAMSRNRSFTLAALGSVQQAHALSAGLVKYRMAPAVSKNSKLKEVVGLLIDNVDSAVKRGSEAGRLAVELRSTLRAVEKAAGLFSTGLMAPMTEYTALETQVKRVGTLLRDLTDRDQIVDPIRLDWLTSNGARVSAGGVAGGGDDDRAKLQLSARKIAAHAKATSQKLAALKII